MNGLAPTTGLPVFIAAILGIVILFVLSGRLIGWALGLGDIRANQRKILSELRALNIHLSPDIEQNPTEE